jgi:cellulose 1,4-beta-cellobiosidase
MSQNGDQYQGNNAAGAKYGTGYCDAQCPHDVKFMNGKANIEDWNSTTAVGKNGSCCAEMDIWEANSMSTSYTLHPCNVEG